MKSRQDVIILFILLFQKSQKKTEKVLSGLRLSHSHFFFFLFLHFHIPLPLYNSFSLSLSRFRTTLFSSSSSHPHCQHLRSSNFGETHVLLLSFLSKFASLGLLMDLQPKTEPGLPPGFGSRISTNLNDMSVSDLVSKLRTAFRFEEFDNVEKVLVSRDARLKVEIDSLQEKIEAERMAKVHAEEELKQREEQCLKGKRAQECYEKLLKKVKKSELADSNAVTELKTRVRELEDERVELEARKKNWEDDKSALDALRKRNSELEEALKKNLAENDKSVIDELRAENTRLLDDKRRLVALVESLEKKFLELHEKLLKLEDDVKPFMSVDASGSGGNTEWEEPKAEPQELKELNEMDVRGSNAGSDLFQRNEDTRHSLGAGIVQQSQSKVDKGAPDASATGRSGLVDIIEIPSDDDDDDDDDQTHRRQKRNLQTLEMLKKKISFSDISSSSSDPSDPPCNKKSKTEVDSPVFNSLLR